MDRVLSFLLQTLRVAIDEHKMKAIASLNPHQRSPFTLKFKTAIAPYFSISNYQINE
jgi:hypothetical protein